MKKMFRVTAIVTLLLVALSSFALAETKEADISFGKKADDDKGGWGFVWTKELDEDGWGIIQPYMKIYIEDIVNKTSRYKSEIDGAYVEEGQPLSTIIGARLGVNYSDYVANFKNDSKLLGVRVYPYSLDLGVADLKFDFTTIFGKYTDDNKDGLKVWEIAPVEPTKLGFLLGVDGNILDADVKAALVRYWSETTEENFFNYSAQAEMEVIPNLVVKGLYAGYSEHEDYLYEVTADYDVLPDTLALRAGHRNSEFKEGYEDAAVLGGSDEKNRYVDETKPLKELYNHGKNFNAGATVWYDFDIVENELKVDWHSSNPKERDDNDDKVAVELKTDVLNFGLFNNISALIPDEEKEDNRYDYTVKLTAEYELPVPVANSFTATGKVNFDWDNNYVEKNRTHSIVGLELASSVDILKAKNVGFGAIAFYDMPSDEDLIDDAFKYALLAKYDAPNGVKFRLEYNSSTDFAIDDKHVHDEELNKRYADFRHYDNSKFDGIRFVVGFPL